MKSIYVKFKNNEDVCNFVNIVCRYDTDFDLVKGRKIIDAKSYLGILCFDLSNPLRLDIHEENDEILRDLTDFIVDVE